MYEIYTINDLDTLEDIAIRCGSSEEELNRINGFGNDFVLENGMQMIIPVNDNNPFIYYTVKKGDNIYDIASKNNVDYKTLMMINGLEDSDYIYPNQTIIIPKNGINIYLTKDDTLNSVIEKLNVDVNDLINYNKDIFLRDEQIIIFKEK